MILTKFYDDNALGKISAWLIGIIFIQPVFTTIPAIIRIESTPFSIFYRLLIVLISIYILIVRIFTRKENRFILTFPVAFSLLFWAFYSLRIYYDLSIRGLQFADHSNFFVYSIAFGNCLLPFIAILSSALYIKQQYIVKVIYISVFLSSICALITVILFFGFRNDIFSTRNIVGEIGVQVIKLSFDGEILIVFSTYFLVFNKKLHSFKKCLIILILIVGILSLIGGASRGPFVGTIFGFILIVLLYLYKRGVTFQSIFKVILVGTLSTFSIFLFYYTVLKSIPLAAIERMFYFFSYRKEGAVEERDFEFAAAWEQFLSSPIIGDSILENFTNYYPHNLILELLMSTGVIGFTVMSIILSSIFIRGLDLIKMGEQWMEEQLMFIFFALIIFFSMFSGGLFIAPYWWAIIGYMLIRSDVLYIKSNNLSK